jgi:hypothetical protein
MAQRKFGFLRNATIAHRDADALLQYRSIRDLRIEEVMAVAIEFFRGVERFVSVLPQIIIASNSFPSLLRQLAASQDER